MANNINLNLPDGVIVNLTQPDADTVTTTVTQSQTALINTAVVQGADKHYSSVITNLSWTTIENEHYVDITHNLAKKPAVTVIDSFDRVLILDVEYIDNNSVKLLTTAKFSGTAYFN